MQEAQLAVEQAYGDAHKAVAAMRGPWDAALAEQRSEVLVDAAKGTWGRALTLRALFNGNTLLWLGSIIGLVVLMGVVGIPPWRLPLILLYHPLYLLSPMFWIHSGLWIVGPLYVLMVWMGRKRLAGKAARAELEALKQLASYKLQALAFGQKHDDGRKHPYPTLPCACPARMPVIR